MRLMREWLQRCWRAAVAPRMLYGWRGADGRWLAHTRISTATRIESPERLFVGDHVYVGPFNLLDASGDLHLGEGEVELTIGIEELRGGKAHEAGAFTAGVVAHQRLVATDLAHEATQAGARDAPLREHPLHFGWQVGAFGRGQGRRRADEQEQAGEESSSQVHRVEGRESAR